MGAKPLSRKKVNALKDMLNKTSRPDYVTDEHLEYLDELRESGVTNMFGAVTYVEAEFDIVDTKARGILAYWMESFGNINR